MRANEVLENVNKMIEAGSNRKGMKWKIDDVCDELGANEDRYECGCYIDDEKGVQYEW